MESLGTGARGGLLFSSSFSFFCFLLFFFLLELVEAADDFEAGGEVLIFAF